MIKKDAYYFSHDANASNDPKCILLIEQLGLEGYGIFWILIEALRQEAEFKLPVSILPGISRRYNTSLEKVKTVINGYQLFSHNEDYFWSDSLNRRMAEREVHRLQMVDMANKRWHKGNLALKQGSNAYALPEHCDSIAGALPTQSQSNAIKERKGKEIKGNIKGNKVTDKKSYGQFLNVYLSEKELENLQNRFGVNGAKDLIERLSEGKESKGYSYVSDYAAALTWSRKDSGAVQGSAGSAAHGGNNGHKTINNPLENIKPVISEPEPESVINGAS